MTIESGLFYFFSSIALIAGALVVTSRNPIHSVLFLILVFANATGLLLLLEVEFLAMLFLMVYVGAIAVLFLFVVMMLNIRLAEISESVLRYLPVGGFIGLIFLFEIFLVVESDLTPLHNAYLLAPTAGETLSSASEQWFFTIESASNIENIGHILYTYYFYFFIVASLILLVAMIGAIVLTIHKRLGVKKQDIFQQVSRDFEKAVLICK